MLFRRRPAGRVARLDRRWKAPPAFVFRLHSKLYQSLTCSGLGPICHRSAARVQHPHWISRVVSPLPRQIHDL